jgi:hypothetical protein
MQIKAVIHRGTLDNDFGHGGSDIDSVDELTGLLKKYPLLITFAVTTIKARIKDNAVAISCTSIDFLDQCLQRNDHDFIHFSKVKVLGRVLKLSLPNRGIHPHIQKKATDAIKNWGATFGSDARLADFANASQKLSAAEESGSCRRSSVASSPIAASLPISRSGRRGSALDPPSQHSPLPSGRRSSAPDLSHMSGEEVARIAKQSQQAIAAQMRATKDKNVLRELQSLHDQLGKDLTVYYQKNPAAAASSAAAADFTRR